MQTSATAAGASQARTGPVSSPARSGRRPLSDVTSQRVLRLHGSLDLRLHDEPKPVPQPGEVLLRIVAVGLCGSDLHWFEHGSIGSTALVDPLVLGHEFAAMVASGPRAGTRVAVEPADPCQTCPTCAEGRGELCDRMRFSGQTPTDGALRSWMTWPERLLVELPPQIPDIQASLLEPLGVALHAVDLADLRPGQRAAVIGSGPIGLLLIRALRSLGIQDIVATDLLPHRVAAARDSGAGEAALAGDEPPPGWLSACDAVFECAGTDAAMATALRLVKPAGRVILVGIPSDDRTSFQASEGRRKGLSLIFCRRMRAADLGRATNLVATGGLALDGLVTEVFPLSQGAAAFEALASRRGLKVVVVPEDPS